MLLLFYFAFTNSKGRALLDHHNHISSKIHDLHVWNKFCKLLYIIFISVNGEFFYTTLHFATGLCNQLAEARKLEGR